MKNVVKGLVVLLAVLLATVGFIPGKIDSGVYSSELTFSQEFRLKSLYLGAYLVSFAYDGDTPTYDFRKDIRPPDWWKQEEARLLSLSDEEFKRELRNNLEKTISQFNPSCMQWNREFLEEIVKEAAPDLYDYINQTYMMKNSKGAQSSLQPANLPSYEPGSNTRTFPAIMYSYLGNAIWGFFCRINWSWDTSSITSVLPSTWGEVYAPLWTYQGIVVNQQGYVSSTTFHKYVIGRFDFLLPGYPVTSNYP
ncbi:MAG: hypothetical protein QMD88_09080 [Coprothermobacterota bacterium]|nr:hypothetical protein [Coprothermobacterota bacterium]